MEMEFYWFFQKVDFFFKPENYENIKISPLIYSKEEKIASSLKWKISID